MRLKMLPPLMVDAARVLVTGGTGFIGGHLIKRLASEGHQVVGLVRKESRRETGQARSNISWKNADLLDPPSLLATTENIDVVYHTAAIQSGASDNTALWATNVDGVHNLVNACLQTKVRRLVFISSTTVYAPPLAEQLSESMPIGGLESYGQSKSMGESIINAAAANGSLEVVIIRPCQVYGRDDRSQFTNNLFKLLASPLMPRILWCDNRFSLVHVDDLVEGILLAGSSPKAGGGVYNITGGSRTSLDELSKTFQQIQSVKQIKFPFPGVLLQLLLVLRWLLKSLRNREITPRLRSYSRTERHGSLLLGGPEFDIAKASTDLGYRPKVSVRQGLEDLLGWH